MKLCLRGLIVLGLLAGAGCQSQDTVAPSQDAKSQMADPFDPDRPPTAKTLYLMADILAAQGRDQQSRQTLERIIKEYPDFFPAYNSLAEIQMRQRQIPDAITTLSAGLKVHPHDPVLLNNLGMCWFLQKNYEKALDYFTQAAGLVPENTRYRSNMATALVLLDRRTEALALYEQILPKEEAAKNVEILCDSIKKRR